MGSKTKIDWCDSTWNPVTGCLHGCKYCYARRIAERFGGCESRRNVNGSYEALTSPYGDELLELAEPVQREMIENTGYYDVEPNVSNYGIAPYPNFFKPTFHRYRLDEPQHWKKPRNIFVCSMADLFGEWVPDEWIQEVFKACEAAPQHRYLFLTKNPERYYVLAENGCLPAEDNFWYGSSTPTPETPYFYDYRARNRVNTFVSIEPLHEKFGTWEFDKPGKLPRWIIIGAETGNRKGKIIPEKAWADEITRQAEQNNIPVFMKESLRGLMGDDFRQEFPW